MKNKSEEKKYGWFAGGYCPECKQGKLIVRLYKGTLECPKCKVVHKLNTR